MSRIFSINFEVFGSVQGVYFRKHTEKQAKSLRLKGWCMNTESGTVKGQLEGSMKNIQDMKLWLQNVGSPKSRILKAEFSVPTEIPKHTLENFIIRR